MEAEETKKSFSELIKEGRERVEELQKEAEKIGEDLNENFLKREA